MEVGNGENTMAPDGFPLFEFRRGRGRASYRLLSASIFVGICLIWVYRTTHIPEEKGRGIWWAWMGMFAAELWFGFYWVLTQSLRWSPVYYTTFKDRLSQRFEKELPYVDIFVCTADPVVEPPLLVVNTILSVMAFDYPQEKLSIFLSDDGASKLTFYAFLEGVNFSKHWIPFCRKFKIEPRSPAVYFSSICEKTDQQYDKQIMDIKNMYKEMENQIETVVKLGTIPDNLAEWHKGFSEWGSLSKRNDHQSILQILIDGRDPESVDIEGSALPTLVYLAREKRPHHPHNFKAGAMNALIRVSSEVTNAPIILNLDCDMYSNNSEILRDALCFFMDENYGDELGYLQLPQNFKNITKNNHYGDSITLVNEVEIPGMNAYGGPCYMGTGCFHRRESITGLQCRKDAPVNGSWIKEGGIVNMDGSTKTLEERALVFASCTYEANTQWGKEMGLKYGCPVEDVMTGISIQCKGWRSVYFNPERKAFLGIAPITLSQMLVQHKRWSEGMFQIFVSKYCPFLYGFKKISLPLQMAYSTYCLWAPCSLAILYYILVSSSSLLKGIALFPEISSLWFVPFAYVIFGAYICSLVEALWSGETLKSWWNIQRTWMMRRIISYFFGFIDTLLCQLGIRSSVFVVTAKVADKEVLERYEQEIMDFRPASPMLTILGTIVLLQLLCFAGAIMKVAVIGDDGLIRVKQLFLQFFLSGMMVLISFPIYEGLFLRTDSGCMPTSVTLKSSALAVAACVLVIGL